LLALLRVATTDAKISELAQASSVEWWAIDQAVIEELLTDDLGRVIKSLPEGSTDAALLLRQLNILTRAGHREEAAKVIKQLAAINIRHQESVLSQAADFLIGREDWELARRFLEELPQAQPGWGYVFIKHWAKQGDAREIDRWLAMRAERNFQYWFDERLRFRVEQGTEGELLDALASEVRAYPNDLARARQYLHALGFTNKKIQVDWLGDVCQPRLAYECYQLGDSLIHRSPRAAASLLERSLALTFTAEDKARIDEDYRHRSAIHIKLIDWEKELRTSTKLSLAQSYKLSGRADKAQPLLEEITAANKDGLPLAGLGQFAGQVQRQSGARVIESRIQKAEANNANSSEYWLTRAEYFAGRQERAQAIEAYQRALELAPLDAEASQLSAFKRHQALSAYARFLAGPSSTSAHEARRLVRQEFDATRLETDYARRLANDLVMSEYGNAPFLSANDDRLWAYLSARKQWGFTEERLLGHMIRNSPPAERNRYWPRAEQLAAHADPTRAQILGGVMTNNEAWERAIPWLKDAVGRLSESEAKESTTLALFGAYLQLGDWEAAEAIWPGARRRLTPSETAERLGRIALAAAKAGALDDALRLWRVKANLDRGHFLHLKDLAQFGLKEQLRSFYQQLGRDNPASWTPKAALRLLE
jgi:hypothetical protein